MTATWPPTSTRRLWKSATRMLPSYVNARPPRRQLNCPLPFAEVRSQTHQGTTMRRKNRNEKAALLNNNDQPHAGRHSPSPSSRRRQGGDVADLRATATSTELALEGPSGQLVHVKCHVLVTADDDRVGFYRCAHASTARARDTARDYRWPRTDRRLQPFSQRTTSSETSAPQAADSLHHKQRNLCTTSSRLSAPQTADSLHQTQRTVCIKCNGLSASNATKTLYPHGAHWAVPRQ